MAQSVIASAFEANFPLLAEVLIASKFPKQGSDIDNGSVKAILVQELQAACNAEEEITVFLGKLFDGKPLPDEEFMLFSMSAYTRLGSSDASRNFLGIVWAVAAAKWDNNQRGLFLSALLYGRHEIFVKLDIAKVLFQRIPLTVGEVSSWILEAHGRVVNDMCQGGFWRCVEAFCCTNPESGISLATNWLDTGLPGSSEKIVENMLPWLRSGVHANRRGSADFVSLENRLKAEGSPALRSIYIRSLLRTSKDFVITENEALDVRKQYVRAGTEEETAWCFLLYSVVSTDKASWHWAHRELLSMARPSWAETSKYWAASAGLYGIETAQQDDAISISDWRDLLQSLLPISGTSVGLWRKIHDTLISMADGNISELQNLIRIITAHSAPTWLEILKDKHFAHLFLVLNEKGIAQVISSDLCFSSGAKLRELGLKVFDECGLKEFDRLIVAGKTALQLELLLLEAQRRLIGYGSLARLHACLADRVDELGGGLAELFYDEVSRQCMNTHEYRFTLAGARPEHEYLQAILKDVGERLAAINTASLSGALKMQVPGQVRAQKLHNRKMGRDVSRSIKEHSTFLNLFQSIHMLYGGTEPRLFLKNGTLGPPIQMQSSSSTVELPRLEFLDPEGMRLGRLAAAARVAALEPDLPNAQERQ